MLVTRLRRSALLSAAVVTALSATAVSSAAAHANPETPTSQLVAPAVTSSNPAEAMATAAVRARTTGAPVAVAGQTTPTQQVMANPQGTFTVLLNATPVRTRQNGTWVELDPTLHRNADGSFSPVASPAGLVLSGGGPGPMATMTNAGSSLSFTWPQLLPTPTVGGANLTYSQILPGVDLVVTALTDGGLSHVLVIHDAAAAANPELAHLKLGVTTATLTLNASSTNAITATDGLGRTVFSAPTPTMWDSSTMPAAKAKTSKAKNGVTAGGAVEPSTSEAPGSGAKVADVAVDVSSDSVTLSMSSGFLPVAAHRAVRIAPALELAELHLQRVVE